MDNEKSISSFKYTKVSPLFGVDNGQICDTSYSTGYSIKESLRLNPNNLKPTEYILTDTGILIAKDDIVTQPIATFDTRGKYFGFVKNLYDFSNPTTMTIEERSDNSIEIWVIETVLGANDDENYGVCTIYECENPYEDTSFVTSSRFKFDLSVKTENDYLFKISSIYCSRDYLHYTLLVSSLGKYDIGQLFVYDSSNDICSIVYNDITGGNADLIIDSNMGDVFYRVVTTTSILTLKPNGFGMMTLIKKDDSTPSCIDLYEIDPITDISWKNYKLSDGLARYMDDTYDDTLVISKAKLGNSTLCSVTINKRSQSINFQSIDSDNNHCEYISIDTTSRNHDKFIHTDISGNCRYCIVVYSDFIYIMDGTDKASYGISLNSTGIPTGVEFSGATILNGGRIYISLIGGDGVLLTNKDNVYNSFVDVLGNKVDTLFTIKEDADLRCTRPFSIYDKNIVVANSDMIYTTVSYDYTDNGLRRYSNRLIGYSDRTGKIMVNIPFETPDTYTNGYEILTISRDSNFMVLVNREIRAFVTINLVKAIITKVINTGSSRYYLVPSDIKFGKLRDVLYFEPGISSNALGEELAIATSEGVAVFTLDDRTNNILKYLCRYSSSSAKTNVFLPVLSESFINTFNKIRGSVFVVSNGYNDGDYNLVSKNYYDISDMKSPNKSTLGKDYSNTIFNGTRIFESGNKLFSNTYKDECIDLLIGGGGDSVVKTLNQTIQLPPFGKSLYMQEWFKAIGSTKVVRGVDYNLCTILGGFYAVAPKSEGGYKYGKYTYNPDFGNETTVKFETVEDSIISKMCDFRCDKLVGISNNSIYYFSETAGGRAFVIEYKNTYSDTCIIQLDTDAELLQLIDNAPNIPGRSLYDTVFSNYLISEDGLYTICVFRSGDKVLIVSKTTTKVVDIPDVFKPILNGDLTKVRVKNIDKNGEFVIVWANEDNEYNYFGAQYNSSFGIFKIMDMVDKTIYPTTNTVACKLVNGNVRSPFNGAFNGIFELNYTYPIHEYDYRYSSDGKLIAGDINLKDGKRYVDPTDIVPPVLTFTYDDSYFNMNIVVRLGSSRNNKDMFDNCYVIKEVDTGRIIEFGGGIFSDIDDDTYVVYTLFKDSDMKDGKVYDLIQRPNLTMPVFNVDVKDIKVLRSPSSDGLTYNHNVAAYYAINSGLPVNHGKRTIPYFTGVFNPSSDVDSESIYSIKGINIGYIINDQGITFNVNGILSELIPYSINSGKLIAVGIIDKSNEVGKYLLNIAVDGIPTIHTVEFSYTVGDIIDSVKLFDKFTGLVDTRFTHVSDIPMDITDEYLLFIKQTGILDYKVSTITSSIHGIIITFYDLNDYEVNITRRGNTNVIDTDIITREGVIGVYDSPNYTIVQVKSDYNDNIRSIVLRHDNEYRPEPNVGGHILTTSGDIITTSSGDKLITD